MFFSADGKPIVNRDHGIAGYLFKYDTRGNTIEEAYLGVDGRPAVRKDIGAARVTWVYDDRGNTIEEACFDVAGNPTLSKTKDAARETWTFDERGNVLSRLFFGIDGKPILNRDHGVAGYLFKYDIRGNTIEEAYVGVDRRLILRKDTDMARWTQVYDARGNVVEIAYFDVDGSPRGFERGRVAMLRMKYDAFDYLIERVHYDVTGQELHRDGEALADQKRRDAIYEAFNSGRYQEALRLQEELTAHVETAEKERAGKAGAETASALGSVSWKALFAREFTKALAAAERALSIDPGLLWIETNRAHALLLLGQFEHARAIYVAHRGKRIPQNSNELWEDVIAEDFAALRAAGIESAAMSDIIRLLQQGGATLQ